MTRVSENSSHAIVHYSLNKNKRKLEDLQLKGSTLKSMTRPSDNPINSIESLALKSRMNDNKQYIKNADFALLNLNATEKSLEQLVDIVVKAKEIALAQSSDLYDQDIRKNVANEVQQLRNQALSIANKRIGNKFIFGGFKSLERPFKSDGTYTGDKNHTTLEVSKDFFVPVNLHGDEVFLSNQKTDLPSPLEGLPVLNKDGSDQPLNQNNRNLASISVPSSDGDQKENVNSIFSQLDTLSSALENNDSTLVQDLLEKFDVTVSRLITLRTRVGSITNSIDNSKITAESENIDSAERKSHLEDADIAELFSDMTKQQNVLKTTYQASQGLINQTLLDFLR